MLNLWFSIFGRFGKSTPLIAVRPSDVVLNVKAGNFDCQLRVVDEALQDVERVRPGVVGGLGGVFLAVGDPQESGHGGLEEGTVATLSPGKNHNIMRKIDKFNEKLTKIDKD